MSEKTKKKSITTSPNNSLFNNSEKVYIFCYGSLINKTIQKKIFGHHPECFRAVITKNAGLKRCWIESSSSGFTLNIVKSNNPSTINGIILSVDKKYLEKSDEYEIKENRHMKKKISWNNINIDGNDLNNNDLNKNNLKTKKLYIYLIDGKLKKEKENRKQIYVSKNTKNYYAKTVIKGFKNCGEDYLDIFMKTTF